MIFIIKTYELFDSILIYSVVQYAILVVVGLFMLTHVENVVVRIYYAFVLKVVKTISNFFFSPVEYLAAKTLQMILQI